MPYVLAISAFLVFNNNEGGKDLRYEIKKQLNEVCIFLKGDLDIDATEIIEEEIMPMVVNFNFVEIHMGEVPFVDSSGIGLLLCMIEDLKKNNIQVLVTHIITEVYDVFSLLEVPEIVGNEILKVKT